MNRHKIQNTKIFVIQNENEEKMFNINTKYQENGNANAKQLKRWTDHQVLVSHGSPSALATALPTSSFSASPPPPSPPSPSPPLHSDVFRTPSKSTNK